jgi:hypothetical protein
MPLEERHVTAVESARAPTSFTVRVDRTRVVLGAIVVGQAVWLAVIMSQGWYLQADLSNLADGLHQPLTWAYLREPLGGHFGPVMRLMYWSLDRLGALNYDLTIALRVLFQALSTILLYRILRLLAGRTGLVLTVVGLYAFSPVLLAGITWMTSGLALGLGQVLILSAVELHVRYHRSGKVKPALGAGLLIALAVLTADQWVVGVLMLPLLAVGYLYEGSARQRLRSFLQYWQEWMLTLLPLVVTVALAAALANSAGASLISVSSAYHLIRNEWLRAVGPSFVGGPWSWFGDPQTYVPFLAPPDEALLIGQIVFVVLVLLGYQRNGWRSLMGWSLPVTSTIATAILIGVGRYEASGLLIAITPRYSFQILVPLALGTALALSPNPAPEAALTPKPTSADRARRVFGVIAVGLIAVMSVVSAVRFTDFWAANPGANYVANLKASVRAAGPTANVYDTPVPADIISVVEPHNHVSDVMRLAGLSARFDDPSSEPMVVTKDGHLARSVFVTGSTAAGILPPNCGTHIKGKGIWTVPLSRPVLPLEWYLRLELYQAKPSEIDVQVRNAKGAVASPTHGSHVSLRTLEALNLRLPAFAPSAVVIRTASASTDLCLVHIRVGAPFPVPGTTR